MPSPQPGLFELNAVVTVATHSSFRRAAAELGLSPSALSHAIATLEQRLGVRLFHRTTRSVALSQAGEQFLSRVRPALVEISGAMEDINALRDTPSGLLRISAAERAGQRLLTPYVIEFMRRCPEMSLDLVIDSRPIDIVAEGFDLGLRLAETVPQDMIAVPFGPDISWAVVGSPGYFAGAGVPDVPQDLMRHRCIRRRLPSGTMYRWEFEARGEEFALDVPGKLTLNTDALMLEAALGGAGLAYVSDLAVAPALASGALVRVLGEFTPKYPGMRLYYPPHRHMRAGVRAFIDLVRQGQRG